MGCIESKHDELDSSDSSYASTTNFGKSTNRKPKAKSKPKVSLSPPTKPVKSKPTKSTKPAKKVAAKVTPVPAAAFNGSQKDADQIDGNKMTVQQPPQQSTERAKSTQLKAATTARKTGWTDDQLLSQLQYLDVDISSNIVRLFDEGNTIPFMCRYRRELIGNFDADK